jgi:hypothetical protein
MSKDPAVLFYADNFLSGTMFFTDAQTGKYIRALCAQQVHGHLTNEQLESIIKGDEKIKEKFCQDENGLFFNERMEKEINKRLHYSEIQRDRVNKRWDKKNTTVLPPNNCGNTCNEIEIEIKSDPDLEIDQDLGKSENPLFDDSWRTDFKAYERIVSKSLLGILQDTAEMEKQQAYFPQYDIGKSLQRSVESFWGVKSGWMHKRKQTKKGSEIDMRSTLLANYEKNRVWKERSDKPSFKNVAPTGKYANVGKES